MDPIVRDNPLKKYWGWILTTGIILLILGTIAVAAPFIATITSVIVFGWCLIFAGVSQIILTFAYRQSNDFFLHALIALLTILIGIFMAFDPAATAITLTLLLAAFFLAAGIFRVYGAIVFRFPQWGWVLIGGILSIILGILILIHWPSSAFWVIGLFIGIELIFTGWSFLMASYIVKR